MILTGNEVYTKRAKHLTTPAKDNEIRYVYNEICYNYRLTNIQSVLGVTQLVQLPKYLEIKKSNYQKIKSKIDKIRGLHHTETPDYAVNNYWMHILQVNTELYVKNREELIQYLSDHKVQTRTARYLNHL